MLKKNLFQKLFNKLVISITKKIESFFTFFRENYSYKKFFSKSSKTVNIKIYISLAIIVLNFISYFLIPAFYDKNKLKVKLENQISDKYNLEVKLDQSLRYGLLPKPHFFMKNVIIKNDSKEISQSENLKIFISLKNFFLPDKVNIKNLTFNRTNFKIEGSDFKFFIKLLNNDKSDQNINFRNNKFFYLDNNNDIIFLTKIKNLNYYYEDIFLNKLNSKLNIFNTPMSIDMSHNIFEKKFSTEIKSYPIRLNIKNETYYNDEDINGELDFKIINQKKKITYNLKNNNLYFSTNDNKFKGYFDLKPFYLQSNLTFYQIDLKKIFKDDSILINILKLEVLNNQNLNGKINININNLKDINFLKEIDFNIFLEEGNMFIENFNTTFKDSVIINLNDTQLIVDNNKLKFAGYVTLDFIDIDKFYSHYQINKINRKNIKKINFGFLFNLEDKLFDIDNFKVDGDIDQNLQQFLDNFNSNKENVLNKIVRRNLLKDFFKTLNSD